jgi:dUTP pyrophosphatase
MTAYTTAETFVRIKPDPGCEDLVPKKAHDDDAGFDLFAAQDFSLKLNEVKVIPTGFRMALEPGWEAQVRPRSGWAAKKGLMVVNSPGTIDAGYRGPVGVILKYTGISSPSEPVTIEFKRGDRIAQMVIQRVPDVDLIVVSELDETARGEGGYGSTNKKPA